jgi:hypothetical protein
MSAKFWDDTHITWAKRFLANHLTLRAAVAEMSELQDRVTEAGLYHGLCGCHPRIWRS